MVTRGKQSFTSRKGIIKAYLAVIESIVGMSNMKVATLNLGVKLIHEQHHDCLELAVVESIVGMSNMKVTTLALGVKFRYMSNIMPVLSSMSKNKHRRS